MSCSPTKPVELLVCETGGPHMPKHSIQPPKYSRHQSANRAIVCHSRRPSRNAGQSVGSRNPAGRSRTVRNTRRHTDQDEHIADVVNRVQTRVRSAVSLQVGHCEARAHGHSTDESLSGQPALDIGDLVQRGPLRAGVHARNLTPKFSFPAGKRNRVRGQGVRFLTGPGALPKFW